MACPCPPLPPAATAKAKIDSVAAAWRYLCHPIQAYKEVLAARFNPATASDSHQQRTSSPATRKALNPTTHGRETATTHIFPFPPWPPSEFRIRRQHVSHDSPTIEHTADRRGHRFHPYRLDRTHTRTDTTLTPPRDPPSCCGDSALRPPRAWITSSRGRRRPRSRR
jgi:hypothetical protein